jgi:hypothetical protein
MLASVIASKAKELLWNPGWNASPPRQGGSQWRKKRGTPVDSCKFPSAAETRKAGREWPSGRGAETMRNTNILQELAHKYWDAWQAEGPVNISENTGGVRADEPERGGTTANKIRYLAVSARKPRGQRKTRYQGQQQAKISPEQARTEQRKRGSCAGQSREGITGTPLLIVADRC